VAAIRRGAELELIGSSGESLARWAVPGWLGVEGERVATSRGGESAVVTTSRGFAVFAAGEAGPVTYFPSEGYLDAPAEFLVQGDRVAIGREDGIVEIWGLESGEVELEFAGFGALAGRPTVLWASDDGEALFAGSARGAVAAWNTRTGNQLWGEFPLEGKVTAVAPGSGASWVMATDGRRVVLLGRRTGDELLTFAIDREGEWVATTPDGYHVSSGAG
jgi:WD40 repeat protein